MASDLQASIRILTQEIERLSAAYLRKREETEELRRRILDLQGDIASRDKEIERLQQDNQFLRMSYRLADSPDGLIETRRKIAGLMRSIEKCISQLKE